VAEVPRPKPAPHQVGIRLRAAGMNSIDRTLASGAWRPAPATFRMVMSVDGAGVVEQVARERRGSRAATRSDEVFGQLLIAPIASAGLSRSMWPSARRHRSPPCRRDPVVAAALPTTDMAGLAPVDLLGSLSGKTVVIVGAGGGSDPSLPNSPRMPARGCH
jgi:NADPH:quinone reductase-like Zn-dependent oxidoreductase